MLLFFGVNLDTTSCLKVVFLSLVYNKSQPHLYIEEMKSQVASSNPFNAGTSLICFQSTFLLLMKFIMHSNDVIMFFASMSKNSMVL